MLPLIGENIAKSTQQHASLWMSALIIVPQIVVAIFAPWIGYHSERRGRRPLLLLGFAVEPARALLLALTSAYAFIVTGQVLGGIAGAIIGVLTIAITTDLTAGTGRFNLTHGIVSALIGIAASLSIVVTGFVSEEFGRRVGFLFIAAIACTATIVLWLFLSETKPDRYDE
jgi:MFS family permease